MKKVTVLLFCVGVLTLGLTGCGQKTAPTDNVPKSAFKGDPSKIPASARLAIAAAMQAKPAANAAQAKRPGTP